MESNTPIDRELQQRSAARRVAARMQRRMEALVQLVIQDTRP
jgi:hypothetical protein